MENIINNFRKLGYKVPNIVIKSIDTFNNDGLMNDFAPMGSDNNKPIIYIDKDLDNNIKAKNELFVHEIAHIITKREHEDKVFRDAINKYNKAYGTKVLIDPNDTYIKINFPHYYKKQELIDKIDTVKDYKKRNFILDTFREFSKDSTLYDSIKVVEDMIKKANSSFNY